MRILHANQFTCILVFIFFLGAVSACSGPETAVTAQIQGVTIARRGVSLLPTLMIGSFTETTPPESTEEIPTSTETAPITPTETPTVPGAGPSRTPEFTPTLAETELPPTDIPTTTPTATPEPEVCEGEVNRVLESAVIALINEERSKAGLTPLSEQSQLTQTARIHAEDMACNDFFGHESPTNGGVVDRVTMQGYAFSAIGEIIAGGYVESEAVVAGWMDSSEHRKNMLSAEFTQIGVGFAQWDASEYITYWVVVFGKPEQ